MKRLVLAGGGHAHVEVLRALAERPEAGVETVLVTPYPRLIYTGMVPGVIAGHFQLEECAIDLEALARRANATLVLESLVRLEPRAQRALCADGTPIGYDVLSLDVGSRVAGLTPGVEKHAVPVRPVERLLAGWGDVLRRAREGAVTSITIVGGGAAGVELALAMQHRLSVERPERTPHVRIITATPGAVEELTAGARRRLLARLAARNIGCHPNATVVEVAGDHVRLDSGIEFASDATFWAAGAAPHDWLRASGLAVDPQGFLLTNDLLQSVIDANVFAAGDCATQEGRPRARAGVFAVRAAPVLAGNLRATLTGMRLERHVTAARYLALVSTGRRHAVGAWNGFAWQGAWCWRWKERIDRRFVARYSATGSG